jgi:two-component system, sensor histidine kinase YesM
MQNRKPIWKNTIFRRLVVTFLLIMLPIYFIGIYIYNWGFHAINDDITKSMTAQVSFYLEKLGSEIERIKILQHDCLTDDNLNNLVFIPDSMSYYDKLYAAKQLQSRLNAISNSSNYIMDVKVSIPALNYMISANQGVNVYDDKRRDIMNSPIISSHSQMVYWKGDFYLNNFYNSTYQNKVLYWIEIQLNKSTFNSDLKQFNMFTDSVSMMYCPLQNIFLTNGADDNSQVLQDSLKQQLKNLKSGTYNVKFNNKRYYGYYFTSEYLGLTLARFIPEDAVLSPVKGYKIWLWVFLGMSLVIIVLFSLSIYSFIHKPLNVLLESFKKVDEGDLALSIEHRHNDEFRHLYRSFNKMVGNIGTLIDQVYKQKILTQNAELKQMQAQINPHFLYNTFFILYSIAKAEDYDTLISFLQQLGSYFKYITRSAEDEVQLYREVEHAKTYANIQALRFSNRISIEFEELPDKFRNLIVPRLIIQPIIENSFKYGLEDKVSDGVLYVRFFESGNCFSIIIEDNGNGMNNEELLRLRDTLINKQDGIEVTGIVNIHRRLQLKFSENSGLGIANSGLGGLKVSINIELPGGKNV